MEELQWLGKTIMLQTIISNSDKDNPIDTIYSAIERAHEEGESVLIHAQRGEGRTIVVLIAYFIKKLGWKFDMALEFMKSRKSSIKLNAGFVQQLKTYQRALNGEG